MALRLRGARRIEQWSARALTMDSLSGAELLLACTVLQERYKACVQRTVAGMLKLGDTDTVESKCRDVWAELSSEKCAALIRSGELTRQRK